MGLLICLFKASPFSFSYYNYPLGQVKDGNISGNRKSCPLHEEIDQILGTLGCLMTTCCGGEWRSGSSAALAFDQTNTHFLFPTVSTDLPPPPPPPLYYAICLFINHKSSTLMATGVNLECIPYSCSNAAACCYYGG